MATLDHSVVAKGNASFANKFYSILAKGKGNVFFSPISAHTVLALAFQGAGGETYKQFVNTLAVPDHKVAASGYNSIMTALNSVKNVTLHIANKVFVMESFPLKDEFAKAAAEQFLSEAQSLNFGDNVNAAKTINTWVEDKTNSKIKDLIKPNVLNALTRLVLVNAVYFKGNWEHKFNKDFTKTEPFYLNEKDKVDCQMMHITKKFNYREDDALDAKILEMRYDNKDVSMVIVLPNKKDGIAELEKKLASVDLATLSNMMSYVEVEVSLPKFKIETEMDLKELLSEMGLDIMFDPDKADFSNISTSDEQLYVSKVIQKAFIEVNEEGAEAAAATAMVAAVKCCAVFPPPKKNIFRADHPFIVVLQAKHNGFPDLLFYGKITQPKL